MVISGSSLMEVDLHRAAGHDQIGLAAAVQAVGHALSGGQGRPQDRRVLVDGQRARRSLGLIAAAIAARGECDQGAAPVLFGKLALCPARRQAGPSRFDPDLEDARRLGLQVELRMQDAGAGRHDLDVADLGAAAVAQVVLVADRALAHVGDDLHVAVAVAVEAAPRLDRVVVPDQQRAETHSRRVVIVGEAEVIARRQPVVVETPQLVEGPNLDHTRPAPGLGRGPGGCVTLG
jgi:hypothetical protein